MSRRRKDTPAGKDDAALWDAVKSSAKPVKRDTVFRDMLTATTVPPSDAPKRKKEKPRRVEVLPLADLPDPVKAPKHRELRHGCAPGVDRRTAERLHRGKMAIQGRLDLHGMSRDAAHIATLGFVTSARLSGKRCVLIVTGKGKGILQTELPRWLNMPPLRDLILSFSHARPQDGGSGAVYVLLKRDRSLP
ncbi:hypothetical protein HH303_11185 [Rhodospirillaceae bacterium KN72]|uniref:Smr domain-containing protein n=1 Tax=Pacificispira spongiicola TaxID=2729598 RepID=A0A7Y0E0P7_9PROT|nr:Smr/MutS family protein [Pacificispira spongiicola]NMM45044.1 hypothetical protein [Pacificispira spongiicola]